MRPRPGARAGPAVPPGHLAIRLLPDLARDQRLRPAVAQHPLSGSGPGPAPLATARRPAAFGRRLILAGRGDAEIGPIADQALDRLRPPFAVGPGVARVGVRRRDALAIEGPDQFV